MDVIGEHESFRLNVPIETLDVGKAVFIKADKMDMPIPARCRQAVRREAASHGLLALLCGQTSAKHSCRSSCKGVSVAAFYVEAQCFSKVAVWADLCAIPKLQSAVEVRQNSIKRVVKVFRHAGNSGCVCVCVYAVKERHRLVN